MINSQLKGKFLHNYKIDYLIFIYKIKINSKLFNKFYWNIANNDYLCSIKSLLLRDTLINALKFEYF